MAAKKVKMKLVGEDGNAFAILGRFKREARRQGFEESWITDVIDEANRGNYDVLIRVMMKYTEEDYLDEEETYA